MVENFHEGLNRSVDEAFRVSSIGSRFKVDTAIDGITLCVLEGATSDDGDSSTKGEEGTAFSADPDVIELLLVLFFPVFLPKVFLFVYIFLVNPSLETYYSLLFCFDVRQLSLFRLWN